MEGAGSFQIGYEGRVTVLALKRVRHPRAMRRKPFDLPANVQRFRELRAARGLTLEALGAEVDALKAEIERLANNKRPINASWAIRLAPALGCSPLEILDIDTRDGLLRSDELALLSKFRSLPQETRVKCMQLIDVLAAS